MQRPTPVTARRMHRRPNSDGDEALTRVDDVDHIDCWRAAWLLVGRHGADASVQAALRIDELAKLDDEAGVVVWQNILHAKDELQRTQPRTGEGRH